MTLIIRTEIEWKYTPVDLFEADYSPPMQGYELSIVSGTVLAKIEGTDITRFQVAKDVETVFRLRRMQTRKRFQLTQADYRQYDENNLAHHTMFCEAGELVVFGEAIDFIHRDHFGNVIRDSKAERVEAETQFINSILSKSQKSPLLRTLFEFYNASIDDPASEMVHLYDVRDALCREFGSKEKATTALQINKKQWSSLGTLTCVKPINQSRHRGKHFKEIRDATDDELNEAREITIVIIKAYADYVAT